MVHRRPRVSVGLPVYNGGRYLAQTLDALLAQTFEDFELIIVDNASTDDTHDICRTFGARDSRIRYERNQCNIGVYRNCNKAFSLATGDYYKLACADDICHPDLLARCVAVLHADPSVVLAYAQTQFVDQDGKWIALQDPGWNLMSDNPRERMRYVIASGHWVNAFFGLTRSNEMAKTRLFPLYVGGDCRLLGELCLRGKFFEIPERLFFRRLHPAAASQQSGLDWHSEFFRGRRGHVDLPFWHICVDHATTALRSGLSARDKLSCIAQISKRMFDGKRALLKELHAASKYCVEEVRQSLWRQSGEHA